MAQPTTSTKNKQSQTLFSGMSEMKRDLIFVGLLYLIMLVLFNKIAFDNMMFADSGDTASAQSWSVAGNHIKETENVDPLWIPYAFSGMPGLGSLAYIPHDVSFIQVVLQWIGKLFFFNATWGWILVHFFLGGVFMYFAGRTLFPGKAGQLPSLLGAITFMMNPFFIGLAETGHGSKLMALSYIPLMFLLTYNLFQRRDLLSLGLLAMAIGTSLLTNHVQMVFYGFMVIGGYALWEIVAEIKHQPKSSAVKTGMFIAALIIGFAISAYVYLSVREYATFSIRGGGGGGGTTDSVTSGGLEYDYATNWSFHPLEIFTYFIPAFFGSHSPDTLYWGWMPFTNSTHYIGLVPLLLGIIAIFYKRNKMTMFLAVFSLFIFILSWGKHFSLLYDAMFHYFPFFNKFRAPDMVLHLMPLTFGLLGLYGYNVLVEMQDKSHEKKRQQLFSILRVSIIAIGACLVIGFAANDAVFTFLSDFMFKRDDDMATYSRQYGAQAKEILPQLYKLRFELLWKDYIKFALIGGSVIGLMMAFLKHKIKATALTLGLTALLVVDLAIMDTQYINPVPNTALGQRFEPDATINFLKADQSQYRVYQIGDFMDNTYMYHHIELIGGYSPAKIKIYQEMIDSMRIHPYQGMMYMPVLSMLNTKYVVVPGRLPDDTSLTIVNFDQEKKLITYQNKNVMPRAWFVDDFSVVKTKKELFNILRSPDFHPRNVAVLEKEPATRPVRSDSTSITSVVYKSREIAYSTYSSQTSMMVFSEVYYPAGWKAYIDGVETEIYKTNFVLRSVIVPSGNHKVEMKFNPVSYEAGYSITLAGWGISLVLVVLGLVKGKFFGKKKTEEV